MSVGVVSVTVSLTAVNDVMVPDVDCGTARRYELLPHAYTVPPAPDAPMSTYRLNHAPAAIRGLVKPDLMSVGVDRSETELSTS